MRPINLKIQGLHSFQALQEVDFTKLCERGTFGIFGPTGSGKSTVLDAITLALFGKVERAPRNTNRGIINHASDSIYVSFSFELNSGEGSNLYRVERTYKRTANNTVQSGNCRLVKISRGDEYVLADKARDVDQEIIKILGLTVDDFTRAVVLPQGKFAEFLTLQGKDRRMMLQRLFNLEAFGDRLQEKVKKREAIISSEIQGIERELQGLGDASEDTLKEAKIEMDKVEKEELASKRELVEAEKMFNASQEIWQKQLQLQEIIKDEELLSQKESEIKAFEVELERAGRAETIKYIIEESEHVETVKNERLITLNLAQEKFNKLNVEEANLKEIYEKAAKELEDRQPILIAKKAKLDEAVKIEEEMADLITKGKDVDAKIKALNTKIQESIQNSNELKKQKEEKAQKLNLNKNKIKNMSFSSEYRQQLNYSYHALSEYETQKKNLDNIIQELKTKKEQLEVAEKDYISTNSEWVNALKEQEEISKQLLEEENKCPADEKELAANKKASGLNAVIINDVCHILTDIEQINLEIADFEEKISNSNKVLNRLNEELQERKTYLSSLESKKEALEKQVSQLERKNLAGILAQELIENEPCPVCGSLHHPNPAKGHMQDNAENVGRDLENITKEIKEVEEIINSYEKDIFQQETVKSSAVSDLNQKKQALAEKKQLLEEKRKTLPEAWKMLDGEQLKLTHSRESKELDELEIRLNNWKEKIEDLKQKAITLERSANSAKANRDVADERLRNYKNQVNNLEIKVAEAQQEAEAKLQQLNNYRKDIPVEKIKEKWQQLNEWDKQLEELNMLTEKLEKEIDDINLTVEKYTDEISLNKIEVAKHTTTLNQLKEEFVLKKQKLHDITQGTTAKKLIENTNKEIESLKEKRDTAKLMYDEKIEETKKAKDMLISAKADYDDIVIRQKSISQKVSQALQEQDFDSVGTAKASIRTTEKRNQLKQTIEAFYNKMKSLEEKRKDIEESLKGKELLEEQWQEIQLKLDQCKKIYESALDKKGAAKQVLNDIEIKHKRWKELNKEYEAYQKQMENILNLKRVLTGNALVEYMAEEHLLNVARIASARLGDLTNNRYTLEIDAEGGFVIRDDANGGFRRPVTSLSGGETFLVSLSLALALSSQIQLKGKYPLEFFFLDEGFGSLDNELLEVVINALERLQMENLSIGVISHVQEMRNRMTRRLIVTPAQAGGEGSKLSIEIG